MSSRTECKCVGALIVDDISFWCRWVGLGRERGHSFCAIDGTGRVSPRLSKVKMDEIMRLVGDFE